MVFSLTDSKTLEDLKYWIRELNLHCGEDLIKVLVGNKSDLTEDRQCNDEFLKEFIEEYNLKYFEVSARTGQNVNEAFDYMNIKIKEKFY